MLYALPPEHVAQWAAQWRAQGKVPVVLDVREDWERVTAHVQQQADESQWTLLGMPMGQIPGHLHTLPPTDTPLACLCHHGVRSLQVARFLAQQGYTEVYDITGGIAAWAEADPRIARY